MTTAPEMSPLMTGFKETMHLLGDVNVHEIDTEDIDGFAARTGFVVRGKGQPEVVLGPQVGVELGHPRTSSHVLLATTSEPGIVVDGRVTRIGPDLDALSRASKAPIGLAVLLEIRPESQPDPFELENVLLLTNRLPGYMVRSVPGRLWVRISRRALEEGMNLRTIATALWLAYHKGFKEVAAVEVVIVTRNDESVEEMAPFALEAKARSGQHKKLVLNEDGDLECAEASCEACEERDVCDAARDILKARREGSP